MRMHIHLTKGAVTADRLMGQLEGMARRGALPAITAAPNINALYEDLLQRMAYALNEIKGTRDAWREDLHPRKSNGQFGSGNVETHADLEPPQKPTTTTSKGGMDKMRELFASGHAFTREELLAATGLVDRKLTDYLAMLKNPKWAGAKGALKIEKNAKGEYFVAMADGRPAPPPVAPPAVVDNDLEGFDAERHARLNETASNLTLQAHRLGDSQTSYHAGERAKSHIRTGLMHMDESRATRSMTPDLRSHLQDKAEQSFRAAASEIKYGQEQLAREAARQAEEAAKVGKTPPVEPNGKYEKYVDQKTTKDAAEWAMRHNYVDHADFGKLDVSVANDYMHALGDHLSEFPMLRERNGFAGSSQAFYKRWYDKQVNAQFESYKTSRDQGSPFWAGKSDNQLRDAAEMRVKKPKAPGKAWALAHSGGKGAAREHNAITFNEKFLTKAKIPAMEASMKSSVNSRWHPPGCDTIKSIADHELGHQLDHLLGLRSNPRVHELIKLAAQHDRGPVHQGMPVGPNVRENIKGSVSQYAATNTAEFIAEAWAEYRNSPDPRHIAAEIGKLVRSTYAQKYGTTA